MRDANVGPLDLAQLEHQRVADVLLLDRRLADEELPRLAVVVGKALRAQPQLRARRPPPGSVRKPRVGFSRGPPSLHEFGS